MLIIERLLACVTPVDDAALIYHRLVICYLEAETRHWPLNYRRPPTSTTSADTNTAQFQ